MTTTVTIKANHGWPVLVTALNPENGNLLAPITRIEPDEERIFHATSVTDLHIHEVQPGECTHCQPYFKFHLGQQVTFIGTSRDGKVVARTEYADDAASYLVRFVNGSGDVKKEWFSAADLEERPMPSYAELASMSAA